MFTLYFTLLGDSSLSVNRLELLDAVLNLCAYHHPKDIILPTGYAKSDHGFTVYVIVHLKCPCDEKMLFSFSLDSNFIFGKTALCQLLLLNFKNKSDLFLKFRYNK